MPLLKTLRHRLQGVRLMLLPFPLAIFLIMSAMHITELLLRPDHSNIESDDADIVIGRFVGFLLVAFLQLLVGIPSLLVLDTTRSGVRGYLVTAAVIALLLSLSWAAFLQAQTSSETLGWLFPRVLFFIGPPLVLSYLLAFSLRRAQDQEN